VAGTLDDVHARRSVPAVKSALVAAPLDLASVAWGAGTGAGAGPPGEQDLQLTEQLPSRQADATRFGRSRSKISNPCATETRVT
jgi:hypothetical protein